VVKKSSPTQCWGKRVFASAKFGLGGEKSASKNIKPCGMKIKKV
jgi:hypothetical protein